MKRLIVLIASMLAIGVAAPAQADAYLHQADARLYCTQVARPQADYNMSRTLKLLSGSGVLSPFTDQVAFTRHSSSNVTVTIRYYNSSSHMYGIDATCQLIGSDTSMYLYSFGLSGVFYRG